MFWQSFATIVCLVVASLILARRLIGFVRAKSKGSCGSCGNCSSRTADIQQGNLVQLGGLPAEKQK